LGEFDTDVIIDGDTYRMKVRMISDTLMQHDLIIGADFLRTVEVAMKEEEILISKSKKNPRVPEIFQIDCIDEKDGPDSAHLDDGCRIALKNMIENYKPDKTRDVNVNMNLILKDDEPVYQRARRLSEQEKNRKTASKPMAKRRYCAAVIVGVCKSRSISAEKGWRL